MTKTPPRDPAPDCIYAPLFGGTRMGPTLPSVSYQLAVNGDEHLAVARWDVASWADRVHRDSLLRAELLRLEQAAAGPSITEVSS